MIQGYWWPLRRGGIPGRGLGGPMPGRRGGQGPGTALRDGCGSKGMVMENPTVVFRGPGEVGIEDRERPEPGPGELLIQTRRSLISTGTERTILSGEFPPGSAWARYCPRYPFLPGYDNVGEVTGTGPGVDPSWVGRRVATASRHALFVASGVGSARPVPDGVADEHAAFVTIAEIVMNAVRRGGVQWGDAVVVYGAGLLGQFTVRFARLCGARPVFAVDTAPGRLDRLPADPVVIPVGPRGEDLAAVVTDRTAGRMADVVFEVTGDPGLIPGEFAVLHDQGRMVLLSSPRGTGTLFNFHDLCNSPSHTIIGAHLSSHPPVETPATRWTRRRHAELFFDLIAHGEVHLDGLVSHRVPYQEAPVIYGALLEDRIEALGVILEWSGPAAPAPRPGGR